jgi:hypothetical protein
MAAVFALGFPLLTASSTFPAAVRTPAKKRAPVRIERAVQSTNRVVIRTTDGTEFKGTLLDRDDPLVTFKTDEGEDLHLPIDDLVSINGQNPSGFLKRFVPVIPQSHLQNYEVSSNSKLRCSFDFLSSWSKAGHASGMAFAAPDEDRRWQGSKFYFILESPPKVTGELSYKSVLKKITDDGSSILNESYTAMGSTRTLLTMEVNKNGQASRSLWQIRNEKGQMCLLQISLIHMDKEKLELPIAGVLLDTVMSSVKFRREQN